MKKTYSNGEITVAWQPDLCIHSERCFHGLPSVFNPKARPWIDIEGASSEEIVAQVNQCPSGALSIVKPETMDQAKTDAMPTRVDVLKDGPVRVCAPLTLKLSDGSEQTLEKDIFLCRCGHSSNKPFCDGSHKRQGFAE
ncbi:MAG: (4Fe-4S)-binding protein [Saprospiraceae bacterium]|nr:(4Fe-4S)-binding protein [Saprospiraceae bacterium]